jgi:beta-phosphoglucomutase-like phosphatase (HAD superfamily)
MGNSCKVVIYDCDGVMFNSLEANFAFYERVLTHMGMSLDRQNEEVVRVLHTYANREVLAYLFPEEKRWQEAVRYAGTINYLELIPLMIMEDGFVSTLQSLQGRVSLAVCTNRSTSMNAVLEGFNLSPYFSLVMTAALVTNPKPHPEPLLRVLDHFGVAPDEALFVGDSQVDAAAAAAARVPFVAYKADLPAMDRIDHHGELLPLVAKRS